MGTPKELGETGWQERRRFRRYAMQLNARTHRDDLKQAGQKPADYVCSVDLNDFSLGGLGVTTSAPLKKKENITVMIPPYGSRPRIDLTGRVVYCRQQTSGYEVGIEFCQTKADIETSPWLRMPGLFYRAGARLRADA